MFEDSSSDESDSEDDSSDDERPSRYASVGEPQVQVEMAENGDVTALVCDGGERIEGDLFVDCSGFRSLIAQQKLGVKFVPFANNLFNDRAVVMPTPHETAPKPQTDSIAMRAGWRWRGLPG